MQDTRLLILYSWVLCTRRGVRLNSQGRDAPRLRRPNTWGSCRQGSEKGQLRMMGTKRQDVLGRRLS